MLQSSIHVSVPQLSCHPSSISAHSIHDLKSHNAPCIQFSYPTPATLLQCITTKSLPLFLSSCLLKSFQSSSCKYIAIQPNDLSINKIHSYTDLSFAMFFACLNSTIIISGQRQSQASIKKEINDKSSSLNSKYYVFL